MEDLSRLLPGDPVSALVPTSQNAASAEPAGSGAMTAPGSEPAACLDDHPDAPEPQVAVTERIALNYPPRRIDKGYSAPHPAWKETPRG